MSSGQGGAQRVKTHDADIGADHISCDFDLRSSRHAFQFILVDSSKQYQQAISEPDLPHNGRSEPVALQRDG